MIFRLVAIILAATVASARAEPPVQPSPVRQALIEALGPGAAVAGSNPSFPSLINAMTPENRADARGRLDTLDREKLAPEALTDLSKVYVLLGAHEPAALAGLALQTRDPNGTRGLILAADAKLEQKDYAASAALAEQALKIDPKDRAAMALFQSAKDRRAPTATASALIPEAQPEIKNPALAADNRPVKPAGRFPTMLVVPELPKESPVQPDRGGAPWLPYVIGGGLFISGVGLTIKHRLEQAGEFAGRTAQETVSSADNLYSNIYNKGQDFFQKHPTASLATIGVAAVIVVALSLPWLGAGAGGGMIYAAASGGNVAVAATASGTGIGVLKVTALTAAAAAPFLMSGDGNAPQMATPDTRAPGSKPTEIDEDQWSRIKRVLKKIRDGRKLDFPKNDGTVYRNSGPGKLPSNPDLEYYREYTVAKVEGIRGPERLVLGKGGEVYFSPDHYYNFMLLP